MAHEAFLNAHRTANETFQILRRMAYWDSMSADSDAWYLQCLICLQYRGTVIRPPTRSGLGDDASVEVLPWCDVIIDMQGPFTRAEGGEQYVLSYLCSKLRVPKLAVLARLQHGYFSRALMICVSPARCCAQ